MRKLFLICLMCTVFTLAFAQFEKDYTPIVLSGTIPKEVIQNIGEKKLEAIKSNSDLKGKEENEYYTILYYTQRNYFISSYLYFNDEFSQYLNQVAEKVMSANNLKGVRIYASKIDEANANAWQNGDIFFNIRLLSWLDNEAQLAYVLSHEISHYTQQHSLQHYKFTHSDNKKDVFNKGTEFEKTLKSLSFSRQQELDADSKGFDFFKKTPYLKKEALNAMLNIEKINDLDEYTDYVNLSALFPDYKTDSVTCTRTNETYMPSPEKYKSDDTLESYSTHPSIQERLTNLRTLLEKTDSTGTLEIVSTSKFNQLKTIAKFENIQYLFNKMEYYDCLYRTLQLMKKYPQNKYLKVKAASCLYWISWYKKIASEDTKPQNLDDQSPLGVFLCNLNTLGDDDFNSYVLNYFKSQLAAYPDTQELQIMYAKLLKIENNKSATEAVNSYINQNPNGQYIRHAKTLKK